jgi:hypothetical protein
MSLKYNLVILETSFIKEWQPRMQELASGRGGSEVLAFSYLRDHEGQSRSQLY